MGEYKKKNSMALLSTKGQFQENCCRLCSKTFCCAECRGVHEEAIHGVYPNCEICLYGRTTISDASLTLLTHIKSAHWPVHCVFCKKIFRSLDELVPHEMCAMGTPKTPQFQQNVKTHLGPGLMTATSTPVLHGVVTPVDHSQISAVHKSSLKGSSSLKSDRRVTFSETPNVTGTRQPIPKSLQEETNELYISVEEEDYKPIPVVPFSDEKENIDNELLLMDKCTTDGTLWESALSRVDFNETTEESLNVNTNINVSLQINVFNANSQQESSNPEKHKNLWASMTNMVKSVVNNISMTAQNRFTSISKKRQQSDDETDVPLKRMKLTDLKCRPPIRTLSPYYQLKFAKPLYVDKATQTDEPWL